MLEEVEPIHEVEDGYVWLATPDIFSVKSYYQIIMQEMQQDYIEDSMKLMWKKLWKAKVPSKVKILCWRLINDRLPIRAQLHKIGIVQDMHYNVGFLCFKEEECIDHLMLYCFITSQIWSNIWS